MNLTIVFTQLIPHFQLCLSPHFNNHNPTIILILYKGMYQQIYNIYISKCIGPYMETKQLEKQQEYHNNTTRDLDSRKLVMISWYGVHFTLTHQSWDQDGWGVCLGIMLHCLSRLRIIVCHISSSQVKSASCVAWKCPNSLIG